jgi:hypothetical protein
MGARFSVCCIRKKGLRGEWKHDAHRYVHFPRTSIIGLSAVSQSEKYHAAQAAQDDGRP